MLVSQTVSIADMSSWNIWRICQLMSCRLFAHKAKPNFLHCILIYQLLMQLCISGGGTKACSSGRGQQAPGRSQQEADRHQGQGQGAERPRGVSGGLSHEGEPPRPWAIVHCRHFSDHQILTTMCKILNRNMCFQSAYYSFIP